MKITLVESEIREAIQAYVLGHFNIKEGMQISMEFTATRGSDGLTASIDISKVADVAQSGPMTQAATVVAVPVPAAPAPTSVPAPKAVAAAPVAALVVADPVNVGDVNQPKVIVQSLVTMPAEPVATTMAEVGESAPAPTAPATNPPTVTRRTLFSSLPAPSNKTAPAAAG